MKDKQAQVRPKFVILLFVAFVIPLLIAFLLPSLASTGKPTPKQRAYRRCLDFAKFVDYTATNNQFLLDVSKLTDKKTSGAYQSGAFLRLIFIAEDLAKQGEGYLIKTNCNTTRTNREIVIICEKPFDYDGANTSFWNLFKRNYAHAVGFSDGKAGLISTTEFTTLDLHGFTSLSQVATNALAKYFGK